MNRDHDKAIRAYVNEYYPADADTRRLIAAATFDLHFGPYGPTPDVEGWSYPGFGEACDRIREYADTLPRTVYVDDDGYVSEHEPAGWVDDDGDWNDPEPYAECGCWRAVFGSLAGYL